MTQRTILAGLTPHVIVHAGGSVTVEGGDGERVLAVTDSRGGLEVERRSGETIGRARARVGNRLLFDLELTTKGRVQKTAPGDAIEVKFGGGGTVLVPTGSSVTVYAGRGADVHTIQGPVTATAGGSLMVRDVHTLLHAAAGGSLDIDCPALNGQDLRFQAGRDLRFYVHELTDARVMVDDLGGYWEGVIGNGTMRIFLKAGGDVTLVTEHNVVAAPPHYILGTIERPAPAGAAPGATGMIDSTSSTV